jgi:tetratricopeptide (TPR) repeat protein
MRKIISRIFILLLLPLPGAGFAAAQSPAGPQESFSPNPILMTIRSVALDPARRHELEQAVNNRDYKLAETILAQEIKRNPPSSQLLTLLAGIFFLDADYLNCAIAYKKAEAIAPLDERSRFTLAMAYVRLNRRDWARPELEKLTAAHPDTALYLYWLARLDYDAQQYKPAIVKLRKVIELDPKMMRAYDSLGLCYDYLGQYDEAEKNYRKAIELNRQLPQPSPWPNLNLAIVLIGRNNLDEAEELLREAIRYDTRLPQSHYQLGQVLEKQEKYAEAIQSLKQAATFDTTYPEPHYSLGRIYQRMGEKAKANESMELFQQLKKAKR